MLPSPGWPRPVLVQRRHVELHAVRAEGVEVAVALPRPVDKFNAQLEGALRAPQELGLVQPQHLVEGLDRRDGGFAHADGADLVALDQRDGAAPTHRTRQRGGRHPAGRAAADDHDAAQRAVAVLHGRAPS